jgi:hypothetical protein
MDKATPMGQEVIYMAFTNNLMGGIQTAFYITAILAVSSVLSSYVLPQGQTLNEWIENRTGLDTAASI